MRTYVRIDVYVLEPVTLRNVRNVVDSCQPIELGLQRGLDSAIFTTLKLRSVDQCGASRACGARAATYGDEQ